jgi:UTP--glucose-1-phosphate uridylyltransferase
MELLNLINSYINFDTELSYIQKELACKIRLLNSEQAKSLSQNLPLFYQKFDTKKTPLIKKAVFTLMYIQATLESSGKIPWSEIQELKQTDLIQYENLPKKKNIPATSLNKLAILKLNGGLGTTMGCTGPKSTIKIDKANSFLDLIAKQIKYQNTQFKTAIPLIFMNSTKTNTPTQKALKNKIEYLEFLQNEFPRISLSNKTPFLYKQNPSQEWYPPGHGDIYLCLLTSGLLDKLLKKGKRYIFISNADNLGASIDLKILDYMIQNKIEFIMETTPKTMLDVKGGTLIRHNNRLTLLERAQVEKNHLAQFEDINKFKIFNTNNIWLDLLALKNNFQQIIINLPLIINEKEANSEPILQLEYAMGAAINTFKKSCSIIVNRTRFLPVKKTSDLMILQSNIIKKEESGQISFSLENKSKQLPIIKLSKEFTTVNDYLKRVKHPPSLTKLDSLELDGNIYINKKTTFEGTVKIKITNNKKYTLQKSHYKNETIII